MTDTLWNLQFPGHWFRAARHGILPSAEKVPTARERAVESGHACITGWLNAGAPVAEVARRAGHSPEVIHRWYEGCIGGHEELNNKKITEAMGWS